jgi:signal transduction histidine kinase
VWSAVALAATGSIYELYRTRSDAMSFGWVFALELSQILTYAPLTPFAFALALRFPVQRDNWPRRSLLHLGFGLVFSTLHSAMRGITPYAYWDAKAGRFASAIWNSQTHSFQIAWAALERLFLANVVDDITGTYVPIILVAHALSYYGRFRDRELHSTKLEMELARSHLQTLKTNLQPHFLFNTMHSISSLMHTNVKAADKMMTRLSDLLRMSLESDELQVTTLNRELEFVAAYLEIEKIRFEERLNVVVNVVPETLDAQVPNLLLQPLVENAVRHGVSRLSAGGTIWITACREGDELHLSIRDNGPGLGESVDKCARTGMGLRATHERLNTLYGAQQSVDIHNVPAGGVEVCIRVPFREEANLSSER